MLKRLLVVIFAICLIVNASGCVALLAGAAGSGGTAIWLSGKLSQRVNAPFDATIKAAKSALKSLKLEITKETIEKKVAQIMSRYTDGKIIWIDIRRVTESSSKVEVRVGAVSSDKTAADEIMKKIMEHL